MGAIDRVSLSKDALRTANIFGHLLIVSSLIVALTNYWYYVEWPFNTFGTGSVSEPFSRGPFSCPETNSAWEVYLFRGFCKRNARTGAQRGADGTKTCVSWSDDSSWKRFDRDSEVKLEFEDGADIWMANCALIPFALLLALATTFGTAFRTSLGSSALLATWSALLFFQWAVMMTVWLIAISSDQMKENKYDGFPGCGNADGRVGPGFVFAVIATMTMLGLAILNAMAASSHKHRMERKVAPGPVTGSRPVATSGAPADQPVQGYRPDIVA